MIRTPLIAVLVPLLLVLAGCDDLGKCTDAQQGRIPVLSPSGNVMYAGQAIMASSCAQGCHSSAATGELRAGAPDGLDFDLNPLRATGTTTVDGPDGPQVVGTTDDAEGMSGLRSRQRKIFDLRELIWEQISKGLMPPSGVGAGFKTVSPGDKVTTMGMGQCTRGDTYAGVNSSATKKTLQQWLACGAPIVEMNSDMIPKPVGGTVGDQYPSCAEDLPPTFENVYMSVFVGGGCTGVGCHGMGSASQGFDLKDLDTAYMELLGDGTGGESTCMGQKMVVPNMPDQSYLLTKLGGSSGTLCGLVMPPIGTTLPPEKIDLVTQWIMMGALPPGSGGQDGGT
jgi:hypothetical protein